jgi:hypothetical protein
MNLKFAVFILNIVSIYGFDITPIRSIVASQAFTSSLIRNINQEFISDTGVIKDIVQYHLHPELDIIYTGMFAVTLYLQYHMFINKNNWEDIELYNIQRRRFNMFLMVLFIIFVRNVDNAI